MTTAVTSIGMKLSISAAIPTSLDDNSSTGFPSLTYTAISRVDRVGPLGDTHDTVADDDVQTGIRTQLKTMKDTGTQDVDYTVVDADAGQTLLKTAAAAINTRYSFKYEVPKSGGTETFYYTGRVANDMLGESGATTKKMRTCVIYRDSAVVTV